jgi:preprotein translocase subunit YajC
MAEIKIQKKKPIWPWIIVILLIGAIVYFIYGRDHQVQSKDNLEIQNDTIIDSTRTDSTANY